MKLVVGLGNPEKRYNDTRHNIGFAVIARLAKRLAVGRPRYRFEAEISETTVDGGTRIGLLCPLTYMNLSGNSVRAAVAFHQIPLDHLLVISDDLNLDLGRIRVRASGSAGGQKGIEDIIRKLGSNEFPRLRIGIGHPPPQWEAKDFVLSKFSKHQLHEVELAIERACDAVVCWLQDGIQVTMNRFNADASIEKQQKRQAPRPRPNVGTGNNDELFLKPDKSDEQIDKLNKNSKSTKSDSKPVADEEANS